MKLTPEHIAAAFRGMSANWRTSILGALLLARVVLALCGVRLPPEADEIVTSTVLGIALLASRDWGVTSEKSGIHRGDAESAEQDNGSGVKASNHTPPSALSAPRR